MGDRQDLSDMSSRHAIRLVRLTQPRLLAGGKGRNVTSAWWQVTLCDPIWHACSRSGEASCKLIYFVCFLFLISDVIRTVQEEE